MWVDSSACVRALHLLKPCAACPHTHFVTVKVNWLLLEVTMTIVYEDPVWKLKAVPDRVQLGQAEPIKMVVALTLFGVIVGPDQVTRAYWSPLPSTTL